VHEDGRAFLARNPGRYDIVVANTLHPWSVGASNLYSLEYFTHAARALRPGGLFVQWLPVERIGAEALGAILRTLAAVFPEGELWWGAESLLVVAGPGAGEPPARLSGEAARALRELGIRSRDELRGRRLGSFAAVREVVPGEPLRDDRPALEVLAAHSRARAPGGELELLRRIAAAAAREGERVQATQLWLDARLARAAGDERGADRLEALAELAGVESARRDRVARTIRAASADAAAGRSAAAIAAFRELLAEFPAHRDARFGLSAGLHEQGRSGEARRELERLLERHPDDAEAWNLLGMLRQAEGDRTGARAALAEAVRADPYLVEALANSGLLALRAGDADAAREMWRRILALSPFGPGPAGRALRAALAG
jgi:tetratricopeptide (TPR) repeat protein